MRPWIGFVLGAGAFSACEGRWDREPDPYDLNFDIPRTELFASRLSAYGLFADEGALLEPSPGVLPYELSSQLFTDYASKQRLLRVPEGASMTLADDATFAFPDGTLLAKTFFYPLDMRSPEQGLRIIETRLLVKAAGDWNVATYLWNSEQTDATLLLDGTTTDVAWIDEAGQPRSTEYVVPHEGECVTCHQSGGVAGVVGPVARHLNRTVLRDGGEANQLAFLQAEGVLQEGAWDTLPALPDYRDVDLSLESRARAYLDINCAHCHHPDGWEEAGDDLDLRFTTPYDQTGIDHNAEEMAERLEEGEMPFLGTTLRHAEGLELVLGYLDGRGSGRRR